MSGESSESILPNGSENLELERAGPQIRKFIYRVIKDSPTSTQIDAGFAKIAANSSNPYVRSLACAFAACSPIFSVDDLAYEEKEGMLIRFCKAHHTTSGKKLITDEVELEKVLKLYTSVKNEVLAAVRYGFRKDIDLALSELRNRFKRLRKYQKIIYRKSLPKEVKADPDSPYKSLVPGVRQLSEMHIIVDFDTREMTPEEMEREYAKLRDIYQTLKIDPKRLFDCVIEGMLDWSRQGVRGRGLQNIGPHTSTATENYRRFELMVDRFELVTGYKANLVDIGKIFLENALNKEWSSDLGGGVQYEDPDYLVQIPKLFGVKLEDCLFVKRYSGIGRMNDVIATPLSSAIKTNGFFPFRFNPEHMAEYCHFYKDYIHFNTKAITTSIKALKDLSGDRFFDNYTNEQILTDRDLLERLYGNIYEYRGLQSVFSGIPLVRGSL